MKVLPDTHTLVWALSDSISLSVAARAALADSPFTASVVNLWELILKKDKAGALVADPLAWWERFIVKQNIPALSIRIPHLKALADLPYLHRDPLDRILVAQAIAEGLTLISKDTLLAQYGVPVIW